VTPAAWTQNAYDFGLGDNNLSFHTAVYVEPPYVYFIGTSNSGGTNRAVLARMTTSALIVGSLSEGLQYWTNTTPPTWTSTSTNLAALFVPGNSETDIQYVPTWGRYIALTYSPLEPTIYVTTAPALTGPWSEPACIYEVPEHGQVSFSIWSYAARPHPEFSTQDGEVVISYATNTAGSTSPLFTPEGLQIYVPKIIRAKFTLAPSAIKDWSLYD
jgi:hypothetical protein